MLGRVAAPHMETAACPRRVVRRIGIDRSRNRICGSTQLPGHSLDHFQSRAVLIG